MAADCDKLIEKARDNPRGLRFSELTKLAECYGFYLDRQRGSHHIYKREGSPARLSFQPARGRKAKPYQVRQLLAEIDRIGRGEAD